MGLRQCGIHLRPHGLGPIMQYLTHIDLYVVKEKQEGEIAMAFVVRTGALQGFEKSFYHWGGDKRPGPYYYRNPQL
jgi:hypothetical protein